MLALCFKERFLDYPCEIILSCLCVFVWVLLFVGNCTLDKCRDTGEIGNLKKENFQMPFGFALLGTQFKQPYFWGI